MAAEDERLVIIIDLDEGQLSSGFKNVEKAGNRSAKRIGGAFNGVVLKFRAGMTSALASIRSTVVGLGATLLAAFALRGIVSNLLDFEKAMVEISTITELTAKRTKDLTKELILYSAQFGTRASDQAKAFYTIISAGVVDATRATLLLKSANELAIGGLAGLDASIDILTSAVNAFGQENLSAARAADILFTTVKLGKTRVSELASSLGTILPTARAIGVTFEEVTGALAALTLKGDSTSLAVTKLNSVFTAILKKQGQATSVLRKNAEVFSLQSLRIKGLTVFLKDLNKALGGSETRLTKLFGRVEGSKAVISLAADGFKKMADSIKEIETSSKTAQAAFEKIDQTIGQKLNKSVANLNAIFLTFSLQSRGVVSDALTGLNDTLLSLLINFDAFIAQIKGVLITLTAVALFLKRGVIFGPLITGLAATKAGLIAFRSSFRINFELALITGETRLKAFRIALLTTSKAVKILSNSLRLFKAVASFGLLIIVDQLIVKIVELEQKFGSFGKALGIFVLRLNLSLLQGLREFIKVLTLEVPKALEFFGINGNRVFVSLTRRIVEARDELKGLDAVAAEVARKAAEAAASGLGAGVVDKLSDALRPEELSITFAKIGEGMFLKFNLETEKGLAQFRQTAASELKQITALFKNAFATGIPNAFASFGKAVAQGKNGLEALGDSVLNTVGALAVQMGQFFILIGSGMLATSSIFGDLKGGQAIAAGIALSVLGGVLQGVASGGGASTAAGNIGPSGVLESEDVLADPDATKGTTEIAVNISGDVFDTQETGFRLVEILRDNFDLEGTDLNVGTA